MNILQLSATELRTAVQTGSLSVTDVATQTIAAMEARKDINAVISSSSELLLENARMLDAKIAENETLPLHGIPVLIKDNIDTVDFKTTGGTPALANHQPSRDAGLVTLLKNAGALIAGKANMHELAFGITSNNACSGAVRNPYDKSLIPGGSSGGSAAAVSARMVPVTIGSDTGGSNRIPAALCGVCGFRPTTDRYPGDGFINLSKTRDTAGIFARHVGDIALVDEVLSGGDKIQAADITQLRLAVPRDPFYKALEKETAEVLETTLKLLADAGATLVEVDASDLFTLNDKVSFQVALYETVRELTEYMDKNVPGVSFVDLCAAIASPDVRHMIDASQGEQKVPQEVYEEAINVYRPQLQQTYADYFKNNEVDAMLYATTPLTARPIGDDETIELNGRRLPTFPSFVRNGDPSSNAGIPSLSIPAGLASNGLPVGMSIDGPMNCDAQVLGIGAAIEGIIPPIKGPAL